MLCTKAGAVLPDPRRSRRICPRFLPHKAFGLMHILRLRHPGFSHKGSAGKLAATSFPAEESSETVTSEEIRASLRRFPPGQQLRIIIRKKRNPCNAPFP